MHRLKSYPNSFKIVVGLAFIVAVIYNSWPLGYWLNPTVAGSALASTFGAVGQPYNWLFIAGDVLCGLGVLVICGFVYQKDKKLIISLAGFLVFGLMTAISALVPLHCGNINSCGFGDIFGWHDVTGAVAGVGQFIGMIYVAVLSKKLSVYKWNKLFLWIWSVLGSLFLLTAIPAINQLKHIMSIAVIWQDIFLVVSGVLIFLSTYTYMKLKLKKKSVASSR